MDTDLLIRSHPYGRPDPFRSVRDLGRVPARCSWASGIPEGRSPGGSQRGSQKAIFVPRYSGSRKLPRIARTLQGMARVRSGQAAAWPLAFGRSARRGLQDQA